MSTVTEATIKQIAQDIHKTALDKGFWEPPNEFIAELNTKLMLIVSEVAEAQEVLRDPYVGLIDPFSQMTAEQRDEFIEELADIIIRTFDLAQYFGLNFGKVILGKMERNTRRPPKHDKRF